MLGQVGLVIIPRVGLREVVERQSARGGVLIYTVVDVKYDIVLAQDGSKHTARVVGEAMDSEDKSTNKAMSAAYKYLCLQTFCIPTEGDNDADGTTHTVAAKANGDTTAENRTSAAALWPVDRHRLPGIITLLVPDRVFLSAFLQLAQWRTYQWRVYLLRL